MHACMQASTRCIPPPPRQAGGGGHAKATALMPYSRASPGVCACMLAACLCVCVCGGVRVCCLRTRTLYHVTPPSVRHQGSPRCVSTHTPLHGYLAPEVLLGRERVPGRFHPHQLCRAAHHCCCTPAGPGGVVARTPTKHPGAATPLAQRVRKPTLPL